MREPFNLMRELKAGAFGEARDAREAWRSWAVYFAIAAGAGVFMALLGAFGTGHAPMGPRIAYWVVSLIAGSAAAQGVVWGLRQIPGLRQRFMLHTALTALGVTVPAVVLMFALNRLFHPYGLQAMTAPLEMFGMVLVVSVAMTGLFNLVAVARARVTHAGPAPARFLERLPPKLRGGVLYAVQAEDHYLRLHTSKGNDLILMRLGDAISELEGIEGVQPHRSWWVSREGVVGVKRTDGKTALLLRDGGEAPVARGNVRALRETGWL